MKRDRTWNRLITTGIVIYMGFVFMLALKMGALL